MLRRILPRSRSAPALVEVGTLLCDFVDPAALKTIAVQSGVRLPPTSVETVHGEKYSGVVGTKLQVVDVSGEAEASAQIRSVYEIELDWNSVLRDLLGALHRAERLVLGIDRIEDPKAWLSADDDADVTAEAVDEAIRDTKYAEFDSLVENQRLVLIESDWRVAVSHEGGRSFELNCLRLTRPFSRRFKGDRPTGAESQRRPLPDGLSVVASLSSDNLTPQAHQRLTRGVVTGGLFGWPVRFSREEGRLFLEPIAVFARLN